jgi:type IV pilus assembly protein PilM
MTASIMALTLPRIHRKPTRSHGRTVVGLDIEPGRVSAAEVSVHGGVRVERSATAELPVGVVRDGEVADVEAVSAALRQLWSEHKGLGRDVRIGVANAKIVMRTVDVPPVTDAAQIDAVVRQIAADELPMPMESAVLDYQALGLVETDNGLRQRVMLVAARKEMVEAVMAAAAGAGLKPRGIDLSAFAMIRALGSGRPDSALYLSVGGLTNLAVVVDGVCLFTRVTGAGLEGMAIELAERRALTLEHARMWLRYVGFEQALADIDGDADIISDARTVLMDGTRRMAAEVRASLEFLYGQSGPDIAIDSAVLTGAAVAVPGFPDALAADLAMPVQTRSVAGSGDGTDDDAELSGLTVAAGLAVAELSA